MFGMFLQVIKDFTETLIEKHKGMMMKLSCSITGNYHDAEDVVQDVLQTLSQKQDILKDLDSDNAKNYIYTVTRNRAVNFCIKNSRENVTIHDPEDFTHIEGEPDVNAFRGEYGFSQEIIDALEHLKTDEKDLICYHYGAGMSFAEISKLTGIDSQTLRKRMQRCKAKLRAILEGAENV